MNITQYKEKRNELSVLLQDVITCLENIDGKYEKLDMSSLRKTKEEIAAIRKKVYEDIYKIVLVAQFQGGKSTSFNALTGGLYISPMGNGSIKCSAAPISAKSVEDPSDVGATVYMRNNKELAELLFVGGYGDVDLTSAEKVEQAKAEWQNDFDGWKENPTIFFQKDDDRDMFFVAGLILEFFNHPVVQKRLQEGNFRIPREDIGKFAKFPDKYLTRYSDGGPCAFSPEEAVYAFVKKVEVSVQGEYMSEIGASFVDAPGLFANTYDTRITRAELADASAVWYLLGAKTPGNEELKAIKDCSELCQGRVFFSANIKGNLISRPQWIEEVLPEIEQKIKPIVTGAKVQPYHALLALLYIQGEYFVTNGHWFDDSVKEFLRERCKALGTPNLDTYTAEQCWKKLVKVCIRQLQPGELDDFNVLPNSLSAEGLAIVRRECNWDGTVEAIREFVVNSKSKSILITDTSKKAVGLIDSLRNLLKMRENEANKSFEETHAAYVEAENKLEAFMQDVEKALGDNFPERKDKDIASDAFDNVFLASVEEIAHEAAPAIADKIGAFRYLSSKVSVLAKKAYRFIRNAWADDPDLTPIESAYVAEINQIMQNTISNVIGGRMTSWLQKTSNGKNERFEDMIITPARTVFEGMRDKWEFKCANDPILNTIAPDAPPMPNALLSGKICATDLSTWKEISLSGLVEDVVTCTLYGLIFCYFPEPIIAAIALFIVEVIRQINRRDTMIVKIREKINEEMAVRFHNEKKNIVTEMAPKLSVFRKSVIESIRKPFGRIVQDFRAAKDAALSDYMGSDLHRKQVAKECKEIRETYLEGEHGLKQRLLNYIEETEPLCTTEYESNK